jgi:hypothetical protein
MMVNKLEILSMFMMLLMLLKYLEYEGKLNGEVFNIGNGKILLLIK